MAKQEEPKSSTSATHAQSISLDQFIEVASTAALRAVDAHLQRQGPHPEPWRQPPWIWVGIIAAPQLPQNLAQGQFAQGKAVGGESSGG
jgi:hypothetical protein